MTPLPTQRLTLREVGPDDAAFVVELLNDPGWARNIGQRNVHTLDDALAYIADRFSKDFWLVARDGQGQAVGMCGIIERDGLDFRDIGYALLERHTGQGYATEAAAAVLRHAFEVLGLPKVVAITAADNTASRRILEKIGLRFVQMIDMPGYDGPSAYFTT